MSAETALYDGIINDLSDGKIQTISQPENGILQGNADPVREFFELPTHASAARILRRVWGDSVIFERLSEHSGVFWKRGQHGIWARFDDAATEAEAILSEAVMRYFDGIRYSGQKHDFERAYAALRKSRSRDFLQSSLALLAETATVPDLSGKWNNKPNCLPVKNGILDYGDDEPILRDAEPGEYFRDPLDADGNRILIPPEPKAFKRLLEDVFPNPDTRKTALQILSLAMANQGHRVISLWTGCGSNGKSLLAEAMTIILGNRAGSIPGAALIRGNDGAHRFAAARLAGKVFAFAEEVQQALDVSECKRISGGSPIMVERKGADAFEIPATWALAVLSNRLPSFQPADDPAFLSRLVVLPFKAIFYQSEEVRERFLRLGADPALMRPARNKSEILAEIEAEREGILRLLIDTWAKVRNRGGAVVQSAESLEAFETYRLNNDKIESFFLAYFVRRDGTEVDYETVLAKWREYFGDKGMPSTRMIMKQLRERFPWLLSRKTCGVQYLVNIDLLPENEQPTNPNTSNSIQNHTVSKPEDSSFSFSFSTNSTENEKIKLDIGKFKKSHREVEIVTFGANGAIQPNGDEEDSGADPESDSAFEDAKTAYLYLLELQAEHRANLKDAGIDVQNARIEVAEWRQRCAQDGISGQRFEAARQLILDMKMAIQNEPYIEVLEVRS